MMRPVGNTGIARRLLVFADREQITAKYRAVQKHAHDRSDNGERDEAVRDAVTAA